MMLKIVPFLVWYRVYASRAGRESLPTVADLSSPTGEGLAYTLLTAGLLGLVVALGAGDVGGIRMAGLLGAPRAPLFRAGVAPASSGRCWPACLGICGLRPAGGCERRSREPRDDRTFDRCTPHRANRGGRAGRAGDGGGPRTGDVDRGPRPGLRRRGRGRPR